MRIWPVVRVGTVSVLMGLALAIAVCRVATPKATTMAALGSLAPMLPVIAGAAAALVATALMGRPSSRWAWTFGTALALCTVGLIWQAPLMVGGQPPRPPAAVEVRAMTINLLGGRANARQVEATARREQVDVLALTEVTPQALAALDAAGIRERFTYRIGKAARGAQGTMLLSRWPLTERPGGDGRARVADVTLTDARTAVVIVAHPAQPQSLHAWRRDLAELADLAVTTRPDIVVGDLNATRDHRPLRALLDQARLRDAVELANAGWEPTWPANWRRKRLGIPVPAFVQIDAVLVRDDGGAVSAQTVDIAGTDHAGMVAQTWLPAVAR